MSKQFAAFHVSWRDAKSRPWGLFSDDAAFGRAAAQALEVRLNELAQEGWIVDKIVPGSGITAQQSASFTIVAFR